MRPEGPRIVINSREAFKLRRGLYKCSILVSDYIDYISQVLGSLSTTGYPSLLRYLVRQRLYSRPTSRCIDGPKPSNTQPLRGTTCSAGTWLHVAVGLRAP